MLRVGTYNLYLGADLLPLLGIGPRGDRESAVAGVMEQLRATAFQRRVPAIARLVADQRADLLGLQEVCTWAVDGVEVADYATLLLSELVTLGEQYDVVATRPSFTGAASVPGSLSGPRIGLVGSDVVLRRRDSAVRVERVSAHTYANALRTDVRTDLPGDALTIARGWCDLHCRLGAEGPAFRFVSTHVEAHDAGVGDRQRAELLEDLAEETVPLVLVGDLNATPARAGPPSPFRDAWVAAGHSRDDPAGGTSGQAPDLGNSESTLSERIDYVWVRDLEVIDCHRFGHRPTDRIDGLWPSDHAGVVAGLELPVTGAGQPAGPR